MQPATHAATDAAAVEAWILRHVAARTGAGPVEPDAVLADLGLSSRDALVLLGDLQQLLGRTIEATVFWQYPTARQLARHLTGTGEPAALPRPAGPTAGGGPGEPIAVIGIGCRFPGATGPEAFWKLLESGTDAVGGDVPGHPPLGRPHGLLADVDQFDAEFFAVSAKEAGHVDPQHRLLLEVAWETLEHAGVPPASLAGTRTGVFVGISGSDYGRLIAREPHLHSLHSGTGQALSVAANRISYTLGLKGPSVAVDTACSSSLVALHLACRSLRSGESDTALAGGVNLLLDTAGTEVFEQAGMMAADGRCKTFDAAADGYVRAEGCGLVLLKRLDAAVRDGDRILAVVRGSAVNQDGRSNGLTAPHGGAQQDVLRDALHDAGLAPADIDYVEAHGTGTPLGDPIEAAALAAVLGDGRPASEPLLLGSVKTNIGHAEAAAGIAGVLKVVLMLRHEHIPAHLHLRERNPRIPAGAPLSVPAAGQPWRPRRGTLTAGVSSFGFGGTNAHVIVQAPPGTQPATKPAAKATAKATAGGNVRSTHLVTVSAKTPAALAALAARYADRLEQRPAPSLADLTAAVHTGRSHFRHRAAFAARTREEAIEQLHRIASGTAHRGLHAGVRPPDGAGGVAFLFSGQGSQYADMGRQLYVTNAGFRATLLRCDEILRDLIGRSLQTVLFPQPDERHLLDETRYTQPALFCLQYALAQLWAGWGVRPAHLLGHSVGQLAAACVAGVFDLEDGLRLVAARGRLVQEHSAPGAMLAAFTGEDTVRAALAAVADPSLAVAAVNADTNVTVAGTPEAVAAVAARLTAAGVTVRPVKSGLAFHSPMMAPARDAFAEVAAALTYRAPRVPLVSDLDGRHFDDLHRPDAAYWTRHLTSTIRHADGVRRLAGSGCATFVEVGPGQVLIGAGRRVVSGARWLPSLRTGAEDGDVLTDALAQLYAAGHDLDWAGLHEGFRRRHVDLPTYPFQRRRFWLPTAHPPEPAPATIPVQRGAEEHVAQPTSAGAEDRVLAELGQVVTTLLESDTPIDPDMSFLELGADSMTLFHTIQSVQRTFEVVVPIGMLFEEVNTLRRLAGYIMRTAPAAVLALREPAPPALPMSPVSAASPLPAAPAALPPLAPGGGGAVDRFLDVHAQVMDQAYELLRRRQPAAAGAGLVPPAAGGVPPAPAAPPAAPAAEATAPAPRTAIPAAPQGTFVAFGPRTGGRSRKLTDAQRAFIAELSRAYIARTCGSRAQAAAERLGHADVRHAPQPYLNLKETRYPIVVTRSQGARVWDVDGNEYLDLTMGFGVNLFGHNEPFINEAITAQLADGMQLGPHSPLVPETTDLIRQLTGKQRVVYCNTGSEAVMVAVRLARAVTGRHRIAMFAGAYHGTADPILARQDIEGASGESVPMAPGIPPEVSANALVLPYGDPASLQVLRERADELAAVIVEPVQSRRPDVQPVEFLREVRRITAGAGIPFVFDEVITGFRTHPNGAQGVFGITADITTYGKVAGGGMPIGIVAGDAKYLDAVDGGAWEFGDQPYPQTVRTFFSGTFCKHPLSLAAARAVLRELVRRGPALQEGLNARTEAFGARLDAMFEGAGVPIRVARFGSLFRLRLVEEPANSERSEIFHTMLVHDGLYIWEGRNCFLSLAHTDEDLDRIVAVVVKAADAMTANGLFPGARPILAAADGHAAAGEL
ncbi:aminotransferase class III-fold pyridoxal phosphate-dependent enzyme [Dactylosporangium sp. NPDC050688]|uniref:type I polyketide synthase n=1 Tax=Dactylosporangium sp. NPDC050688 TaxID=3157217 RepID=UPI0033F6B78D